MGFIQQMENIRQNQTLKRLVGEVGMMNITNFLPELKRRAPATAWPWLLLALQHDALIWQNLKQGTLASQALDHLSDRPESWSPANLALLALQAELSLPDGQQSETVENAAYELKNLVRRPLPEPVLRKAQAVYQEWIQEPEVPLTLVQCAYLALWFRELSAFHQDWASALHAPGLVGPAAPTLAACLFGLVEPPEALLLTLAQIEPKLAVHALLSNPAAPEVQVQRLEGLFAELAHIGDSRTGSFAGASQRIAPHLAILKELATQRPALAARLAEQLLQSEAYPPGGAKRLPMDLEDLQARQQAAELLQLSERSTEAIPAWQGALLAARRWQAYLSGRLAQALTAASRLQPSVSVDPTAPSDSLQGAVLEAWRQAVTAAPDVPAYTIALIRTLHQAGQEAEAEAYLANMDLQTPGRQSAGLLALKAQQSKRQGDASAARKSALQALALLEESSGLDDSNPAVGMLAEIEMPESEFVALAQILSEAGLSEEAVQAARLGLQRFPVSQPLLDVQARAELALEAPGAALASAYTLLALDEINSSASGSCPEGEEQTGATAHAAENRVSVQNHGEGHAKRRRDVHHLIVDSLERAGSWQAALDERTRLLAEQDGSNGDLDQQLADYYGLAQCALRAGRPSQALQASQKGLDVASADQAAPAGRMQFEGLMHALAGKAAFELGDYDQAIQHLSRAVDLAPEQGTTWLGLAELYERRGQLEQAVEVLHRANQAASDNPEILLRLGRAYLNSQAPTRALAYLRQADKLAPSELSALPLGQALLQLGHLAEARQVLQQVVDSLRSQQQTDTGGGDSGREEMLTDAQWAFARVLLGQGEQALAIPYLEAVTTARPGDPAPALAYVQVILPPDDQPAEQKGAGGHRTASAQKAVALLEKYLATSGAANPNSSRETGRIGLENEVRAWLAEAYLAAGELKKALNSYRAVLDTSLRRQPAWRARLALGLGRVAMQLDHPELALATLQEAAEAEPIDSVHNLALKKSLSEAYLASGMGQQALQTARSALQLSESSPAMLNWFTDLGLRLYEQEGDHTPYRVELIAALQSILQHEPGRADLLARLGRLQLENADPGAAQQTFRDFVTVQDDSHTLSPQDLSQAAEAMLEIEDAPLAIALLWRAIKQETSAASKPEDPLAEGEFTTLADLYKRLSQVHQVQGDQPSALQALDQALALKPERADLYALKADLLDENLQPEMVLDCLEHALALQPQHAGWHYRSARLLYELGDFAVALRHADQAVTLSMSGEDDNAEEGSQAIDARLLAVDLAYHLLRPRQALSYLPGLLQPEDPQQAYEALCLQAELALDAGEEDLAAQAIAALQKVAPQRVRSLAIQARLFARQGDVVTGMKLLESALEGLENPNSKAVTGREGRVPGREAFRSAGQAAAELGQLDLAYHCCGQSCREKPTDPLSELKFAQVMVQQAEAQWLCKDLEVTRHGPTKLALDENSWKIFSETLAEAERLVSNIPPWEDVVTEFRPDEPVVALRLWRARGMLAFQPTLEHVLSYESELKSVLPQPVEVTALIMGLRQARQTERALQVARGEWRPELAPAWTNHPLVLTQLGLTLEFPEPQRALEAAELALNRAEETAAIWPERPMSHFLLARLAYRLMDLDRALSELKLALSAWPEEGRWLLLAAQIYMGLGVPDLDAALAELQKVECQGSECAPVYYKLGCGYLDRGDAQNAAPLLEQAARLDPTQAGTWIRLAEAYRSMGDLEQAAASAEQAIGLQDAKSPEMIPALLIRAEIALQANNPRGALSRSQALLQLKPDHAQGLHLLARALEALNRPGDALAAIERAIAVTKNVTPGNLGEQELRDLHLARLQLLRQVKGLHTALPALEELAASQPKDANLLAIAADWLAEAGKSEAAIQAARLALQVDQDQLGEKQRGRLNFLIGMAMRKAGQLDQAIHYLSQGAQVGDLDTLLELGRAYQERREFRLAIKAFQKAIQVAPNDHRAYYQAGVVLRDSKDYVAAEAMLRRAAQLVPNDVSVHRQLGAVVALSLVHNGGLRSQ